MRPRSDDEDDEDDSEPPTKYRCVEATSTSASTAVSMDCTNVKSKRRRTRTKVATAPLRRFRSAHEKAEIINYAIRTTPPPSCTCAVQLEHGNDEDGDPCIKFGRVVKLKPV